MLEPQEWLQRFADWRKCQPGSPKRQAYEIIKSPGSRGQNHRKLDGPDRRPAPAREYQGEGSANPCRAGPGTGLAAIGRRKLWTPHQGREVKALAATMPVTARIQKKTQDMPCR